MDIHVFEILAYVGSGQTLLLAYVLAFQLDAHCISNKLLAIFLITTSVSLLAFGLDHQPYFAAMDLPVKLAWINFTTAPLLWLYSRSLTVHDFRLEKRHLLHFVPALVIWLSVFLSAVLDINLTRDQLEHAEGHTSIIYLVILSLIVYSVDLLRRIQRHQQQLLSTVSSMEMVNLTWLRQLVIVFLVYVVIVLLIEPLRLIDSIPYETHGQRSIMFAFLFFYVIGLAAIRQPYLFSADYQQLLADYESITRGAGEKLTKYEKSGLTPEAADQLWERLQQLMIEKTLYLDPELRIPTLANTLLTPVNYLSQTINTRGNETFYDFVNRYRVEHAKRVLLDTGAKQISVLDIAMASGFSSQSAFYKAFKKQVGITPAKFRKLGARSPVLTPSVDMEKP